MTKRRALFGQLFASAILFLATVLPAQEAGISKLEQEAIFHIEKGPLELALIQFSRQAEVQVVLAPDSASNLTASAVSGRLIVNVALTTLLKGTGLSYSTVGNTVMVQVTDNKNASLRRPGAST